MPSRFIDPQTRRLFIEGLIDTLSSIFHIEDEVQKVALYNELTILDDEALIEKQKAVKEYMEDIHTVSSLYRGKINSLEHAAEEFEEKSNLNINFN